MSLLARKDMREAVRLLRVLQIHLDSAIESSIAPGETEACAAIDAPHLAEDRADFKSAERLIKAIDIVLGDRKIARTVNRELPDSRRRKTEQN